ncbi:MAG: hypothetical protein OHK0029_35680 [Armatimonadaceae bacterium]
MERIAVDAQVRPAHMTKGERKALRHQGVVLGSVYGKDLEATPILMQGSDLLRVVSGESGINTLIDLKLEGKTHLVRISTLETETVTNRPMHIGLHKVSLKDTQKTSVPVELLGEPEAVQNNTGLLDQALMTVDIRAKLQDLVPTLQVDISNMQVGDVIRAGDLELPEGCELMIDPESPVVSLQAAPVLAVEPVETEEVPAAEVEVVGEEGEPAEEVPATEQGT